MIHIYVDGARQFGAAQAEAYQDALEERFALLALNPRMARERREISPPVRINPCGSHVIVYVLDEEDEVDIVRIRHGRENWSDDPVG